MLNITNKKKIFITALKWFKSLADSLEMIEECIMKCNNITGCYYKSLKKFNVRNLLNARCETNIERGYHPLGTPQSEFPTLKLLK